MATALTSHQDRHGDQDRRPVLDDDVEVERQADGHEEQAEQDAAERLDIGFELVPVGGFGEHHAGDERAHRHRQAGELHQRRRSEHDEQRRGDHRLLGAGVGDDAEQRVEQIAAGDQQARRSPPTAMHELLATPGCGASADLERSSGISASSGTIARSWNSRIEKAVWP